jgi:hypothetical protein
MTEWLWRQMFDLGDRGQQGGGAYFQKVAVVLCQYKILYSRRVDFGDGGDIPTEVMHIPRVWRSFLPVPVHETIFEGSAFGGGGELPAAAAGV